MINKKIFITVGVIIAIIMLVAIIFLSSSKKTSTEGGSGSTGAGGNVVMDSRLPHVDHLYFTSGPAHHTDKYRFTKKDRFAVRRGFPFDIKSVSSDMRNYTVSSGNEDITVNIKNAYRDTLTLITSVQTDIGHTELLLTNKTNGNIFKFDVYVIFNPWHEDDIVYMKDKKLLDEYIMNEYGWLVLGGDINGDPMLWYYAQFDEDCFLASIKMLSLTDTEKDRGIIGATDDKGDPMTPSAKIDKSDPISVSRLMTAIIGSNVITGNWDPNSDALDDDGQKVFCNPSQEVPPFNQYYSSDCDGLGTKDYNDNDIEPHCDLTSNRQDPQCGIETSDGPDGKKAWVVPSGYTYDEISCANMDNPHEYCQNLIDRNSYFQGKVQCISAQQRICKNRGTFWKTTPGEWSSIGGSLAILKRYRANQINNPDEMNFWTVQFGQCWVMGGILNTVMRTLGIPSTQIINYASAHPECDSLGAQYMCDDFIGPQMVKYPNIMIGDKDKGRGQYTNGSIWNFHSWNHVWMRRPDLKYSNEGKYAEAGWQAVDATQQETSFGVNQLGPAPLAAVKDLGGAKYHNRWSNTTDQAIAASYDTCFIIAEANYYVSQPNNWSSGKRGGRTTNYTLVPGDSRVSTSAIGASPDSKPTNAWPKSGDFDPNVISDITYLYKQGPNTPDEHAIRLFSAAPTLDRAHSLFKNKEHPHIKLEITPDGVTGDLVINIFFFSQVDATGVPFTINTDQVDYTNKVIGKTNLKITGSVDLKRGVTRKTLTHRRSAFNLVDSNYIQFTCSSIYPGQQKEYYDTVTVYFAPPPLTIKTPRDGTSVKVSFTNPYKISITNAVFKVNVPSISITKQKHVTLINPGENASFVVPIINLHKLHHTLDKVVIMASFKCDEIHDRSHASTSILVH